MIDKCEYCDEYSDCRIANTQQAYMCGQAGLAIWADKVRSEKEDEDGRE